MIRYAIIVKNTVFAIFKFSAGVQYHQTLDMYIMLGMMCIFLV